MNEFNRNWLNLVLEYKDNPDVTFDLSQNDVRILLTYIEVLQSKIDKAIEYIEKNTHNIYADGYRDRMTGMLLSKEKTPIIDRVFSQNPQKLLDILKEVENVENN